MMVKTVRHLGLKVSRALARFATLMTPTRIKLLRRSRRLFRRAPSARLVELLRRRGPRIRVRRSGQSRLNARQVVVEGVLIFQVQESLRDEQGGRQHQDDHKGPPRRPEENLFDAGAFAIDKHGGHKRYSRRE